MNDPFAAVFGEQAVSHPPVAAPKAIAATAQPKFSDDNDAMVRTVYAEADPASRQAVAAVIRNRANKSGKSYTDVVTEPGQFEAVSNPRAAARMNALDPNSEEYKAIAAEIAPVLAGKVDPTNGADSYYAPKLQSDLGRAKPAWDDGTGQAIGGHLFFSGKYGGQDNGAMDAVFGKAGDSQAPTDGVFQPTPNSKRSGQDFVVRGADGNPNGGMNPAQVKTYQQLDAAGLIDRRHGAGATVAGTLGMPYVQTEKGIVPTTPTGDVMPGVWYVSVTGKLHQTPGKPISSGEGLIHGGAQGVIDVGASGVNAVKGLEDNPAVSGVMGQQFSMAAQVHDALMRAIGQPTIGDVQNKLIGERDVYDARYGGNGYAATGRVGGQIAATAPLMAMTGGAIDAAPGLELLAGTAGKGGTGLPNLLLRGTSLATRGALEGGEAAGLTSSTSDAPVQQQIGIGALAGGPMGLLAPVAAAAGKSLVRSVVRPKPDALAGELLNKLIVAGKADPAALASAGGLTTAEKIGTGAEGTLMALSRRPGTTGEALTSTLEGRNASLPRRVEDATHEATGLQRDFISGDVDSIVKKAQSEAKPLFDQYNELGPLTSPQMEDILQRPSVQKALKLALTNAKEGGYSKEDIVTLQELVDGMPTDKGPTGNANNYVQSAQEYLATRNADKSLKRALGPSLVDYLASTGGLKDAGGDIAALDGHIAHKGTPFARKLVTPSGRGLDDAAQAAWEQGYFPDLPQAPSTNRMIEAIQQELAGHKLYAKQATEAGVLAGRVNDFERQLARYGVDPTGKTAKQIATELAHEEAITKSYQDLHDLGSASQEPATEAVTKAVPTARALNVVKKVMDSQYMNRQERALTGRLNEDDAALAYEKDRTYGAFRDELKKIVTDRGFDFDNLMQKGGEAPKIKQAFKDGAKMIRTNDIDGLRTLTRGMSAIERKTALGGFINDLTTRVSAKQGIPFNELKLYASDDFAKRVGLLADDPAVGAKFQKAMESLKLERRGQRMMPRTNSVTGDLALGNDTLKDGGLSGMDITDLANPKKGAMKYLASKAQQIGDMVTTPGQQAARDKLGNLLIDPVAAQAAILKMAGPDTRNKLIAAMREAKNPNLLVDSSGNVTFNGEVIPPAKVNKLSTLKKHLVPAGVIVGRNLLVGNSQ